MAHHKDVARDGHLFVTGTLETLLPANSVARTIMAALARLDFSAFDAAYENDSVGASSFDPRTLVGVWVLAFLRGEMRLETLAALCERDIEFRWILGEGNRVGKSTLGAFRNRHGAALTQLAGRLTAALLSEQSSSGKRLGVDGTVIRAAASKHAVRTRKHLEQEAQRLETLFAAQLAASDTGGSAVSEPLEQRRSAVEALLAQMAALGLTNPEDSVTTTDPSARLLRQKDGSFAPGYNLQAVVDLDSGVLLHTAVLVGGSDSGQLQPQVEQTQAVLNAQGLEPAVAAVVADAGYHDARQLAALEAQRIACYVPEDRNAHRMPPGVAPEYQAKTFAYDETTDIYRCPRGHELKPCGMNESQTAMRYQARTRDCASCPAKPQCCPKSKSGRRVNRPLYKAVQEHVAERVQSDEGVAMAHARSATCEGVFARLKCLLHWPRCRLWGLAGVRTELTWRHFIHNLMLYTKLWKPLMARAPEKA